MILRDTISAIGTDSALATIAVVAVLVCSVVAVGPAGAQSTQSTADEYAIVQGDDCYTVEAFGDGSQSIEEFYDYRTPETEPSSYYYSSFGTTQLQEDDTSNVFLYEGSEGVSLVLIHGQVEGDSPGGAVTMQLDGLPEDGEWVIEDDDYSEDLGDGPFDEFEHDDTSSRITWVYTDNRSDGAAFRGLEGEFAVTVDPAFNDAADYRLYDGQITEWRALSPTDNGYEARSLDMDRAIEIRPGDCTSYAVTDVETNGPVTAGESLEIEATVENDGAIAGTFTVPITVDGEQVDQRAVTLDRGETTTVSTSVTLEEAGSYTVGVGNETTEATVDDGGDDSDEELPGFGVTVAAVAVLLAVLLARYRR